MCTCVRFNDTKGEMFFGRNLDWASGYGEKIIVTPRGYKYQSAFLGEMTARAGAVIGMAVVADNVPLYFDCANEAGLAVAGLNFPGYAAYETTTREGKTNVAAYEFPLYVAMNYKTVDEAEAALKNVAIVAKPVSEQYPVSELHFMIGDRKRSIVVEYGKNGMEIFENAVDVLTNQPGYEWHRENLRNYMNLFPQMPKSVKWGAAEILPFGTGSLMRGMPGDYYSSSRFIRVAYLNTHYPTKDSEAENVARLFHTLGGVAMIEGASDMADGRSEYTVYTGGYSTAERAYYYNTYEDFTVKKVAMNNYDLEGSELITAI